MSSSIGSSSSSSEPVYVTGEILKDKDNKPASLKILSPQSNKVQTVFTSIDLAVPSSFLAGKSRLIGPPHYVTISVNNGKEVTQVNVKINRLAQAIGVQDEAILEALKNQGGVERLINQRVGMDNLQAEEETEIVNSSSRNSSKNPLEISTTTFHSVTENDEFEEFNHSTRESGLLSPDSISRPITPFSSEEKSPIEEKFLGGFDPDANGTTSHLSDNEVIFEIPRDLREKAYEIFHEAYPDNTDYTSENFNFPIDELVEGLKSYYKIYSPELKLQHRDYFEKLIKLEVAYNAFLNQSKVQFSSEDILRKEEDPKGINPVRRETFKHLNGVGEEVSIKDFTDALQIAINNNVDWVTTDIPHYAEQLANVTTYVPFITFVITETLNRIADVIIKEELKQENVTPELLINTLLSVLKEKNTHLEKFNWEEYQQNYPENTPEETRAAFDDMRSIQIAAGRVSADEQMVIRLLKKQELDRATFSYYQDAIRWLTNDRDLPFVLRKFAKGIVEER